MVHNVIWKGTGKSKDVRIDKIKDITGSLLGLKKKKKGSMNLVTGFRNKRAQILTRAYPP